MRITECEKTNADCYAVQIGPLMGKRTDSPQCYFIFQVTLRIIRVVLVRKMGTGEIIGASPHEKKVHEHRQTIYTSEAIEYQVERCDYMLIKDTSTIQGSITC